MKNRASGSGLQPQTTATKMRGTEAVVVVAVRAAAREISKTAVVWALTHVVQHGDSILLLAVNPPQTSGRSKFWGFPFFAGGCASGHRAVLNQTSDFSELCSQMMHKLRDVYDPSKINVKVKVLSGSPSGCVATESKRAQASWVVLDKELKHEEKRCLEELQCNIVVMKRSRPKVLRLNLSGSPEKESKSTPPDSSDSVGKTTADVKEQRSSIRGPAVTPSSSPESETAFESTDVGTSSVSSSDPATSPFCASDTNSSLKKEAAKDNILHSDVNISDSESEASTPLPASSLQPWMADILERPTPSRIVGNRPRRTPTADALLEKISKLDLLTEINAIRSRSDLNFRGNVRDVISLSRSAPPGPPPLCSICQHKTPVFGKPPRWFSYAELELATGGFSQANFLAEGGFGSVHRGVLPDGQAIAVKQHKLASSQGDVEFCSEVEVLSCAQHRNVVMLIGFCVEDKRRLLVYEYICNGSLDSHLYDFGLARWQPDGDMGVDTRVIGTFGYLAPEYAQSGQITEKADVYSFGVVLVELVTGRKAVDINRPKGQQFLTEWARPLLEDYAIDELIDPRLERRFSENEVLRILEGDMVVDASGISTPGSDAGSRSWRLLNERHGSPAQRDSQRMDEGKHSYAWDRDRQKQNLSHRY
ncbi:hypothetical protein EJB05_52580 [Eragrostis curvula]|uniref:Protein kinase domain-containing protein n=1 Tax=Eragrostis curvula TaxID=38414 RepID=A0A5J9SSE3_9POAL|nr:hypothetical protein EJB05_52580 [Eragrostis curvula]